MIEILINWQHNGTQFVKKRRNKKIKGRNEDLPWIFGCEWSSRVPKSGLEFGAGGSGNIVERGLRFGSRGSGNIVEPGLRFGHGSW
jgi:hypothetical protein